MATVLDILESPSDQVIDGLKDSMRDTDRIVTFTVRSRDGNRLKTKIRCHVETITREDGSGKSFMFIAFGVARSSKVYEGYFHTHDRKGTMTVYDNYAEFARAQIRKYINTSGLLDGCSIYANGTITVRGRVVGQLSDLERIVDILKDPTRPSPASIHPDKVKPFLMFVW